MYKYQIYKGKKLVGDMINKREAIEMLKISYHTLDNKMSLADDKGVEIKGFIVTKHDMENVWKGIYPKDLLDEWDRMTLVAELIRSNQGRIVTEIAKGKRIKYTVPRGR